MRGGFGASLLLRPSSIGTATAATTTSDCPYLRPSKLLASSASAFSPAAAAATTTSDAKVPAPVHQFVPLKKEEEQQSSGSVGAAVPPSTSSGGFTFGEKLEERADVKKDDVPEAAVASRKRKISGDDDQDATATATDDGSTTGEEGEVNVIQVQSSIQFPNLENY
jgi:hypothetical protein